MNPEAIVSIVTGVLGLVSTVLPMIGNNSAGTQQIGKVIGAVTSLAPLVTDQIGVVYTGIKNVIASVGAHPATTAAQRATLADFDKRVDDAWNAIEGQIDPDSGQAE